MWFLNGNSRELGWDFYVSRKIMTSSRRHIICLWKINIPYMKEMSSFERVLRYFLKIMLVMSTTYARDVLTSRKQISFVE